MLPTTGRVGNVGQPIGIAPPALHLPFAVGKVLDPRFTWTGASARTMYNSSGVLQYAPHQILANTNLSDQTDEVPAGWADFVGTGFKTFTDQGGYFEVSENAVANRTKLSIAAVPVLADTAYTVGVYVKSYTGAQPFVATLSTGGTDGAVASATFTGEGWYATGSLQGAGDTSLSFLVGLGLNANETATMVWSRPFIVKGLLPGVSVGTTGVKLSGPPLGEWIGIDDGDEPLYKPRFTHDPSDNTSLGLQIEGARTNYILQSEDFSTTWTASSSPNVTSNTTVAPDGNTTADTIEDPSTSFSLVQQHSATAGNSETWCASMFILKDAIAKTTRNSRMDLIFTGGTNTTFTVGFATDDGEINGRKVGGGGTYVNAGVFDSGDYWRFWVSGTNDATGNTSAGILLYPAVGDNADLQTTDTNVTGSVVAWGAMLEKNSSFPSSYLPTTTAAVARAADVCTTSDLSWLAEGTGTFYANHRPTQVAVSNLGVFSVNNGTSNRIDLRQATNSINCLITDGGVSGVNAFDVATLAVNVSVKHAFAYIENDFALVSDGGTAVTDSSFTVPANADMNIFRLGNLDAGGNWNYGTIAELKYWGSRLPNTRLVTETT